MDFLSLVAKLTLDSSAYESGLSKAKGLASSIGGGIAAGLKVAGAAVGAATTAVMGFATASVKTGADFDKSMSQVAATMGLTMDEMANQTGKVDLAWGTFTGNLRDYAQEMGKNTAFSATEAADALNYMALAGYDVQTSMQMLPNVLNLAAAGGMELARASDMVTDTQTAFGISLERTSQMVDEMAKAASTGNTSVEQLGDAFLTVGGLAQELNGGMVTLKNGTTQSVDGVQELEIALTAMANAGIKGSEAGTHMRNMLLKLASPTSEGTKALKDMGVSVFDTEGKMRSLADIMSDLSGELGNMTQEQKIQTISDLFNTRDLASAEALLNAVDQDWDKIGASILDAEGAAQKMADTQLDNLAGDITLFKSALEGAQIVVSDGLTPSFRKFVQFGTTGLGELTNAFKSGGISGAMEKFGDLLSEGISMITQALPTFVDAGLELLGAFGQGLIDNAPVIFDALVEIGSMLGERLLNIMQEVADLTADFDWATAVQNLIDNIVNFFTSDGMQKFLKLGAEILINIGNGLISAIPTLVTNAQQLMTSVGEGLKTGIPQILPIALNAIMDFSGSLRENAGKLIDSGLDMILNIADGLIKAIPDLIKTVPTIVSNIAGIINDNAPKLIFAGITLIGKLVVGIVQSIPTIIAEFPKIIKAIFDVITAVNWISLGAKIITGIVSGVKSLATSLPQALKDIGAKAVEWLKLINWKTLGKDVIDLIIIGIKAVTQLIPNALKAIGDLAVTTFKNIDWKTLGKHLVEGIWAGITGSFDWITQRITEWCGSVIDWFKKVLKIGSPSKLMRDEVGKYIGEGVAVGITQSLPEVQDALNEMTDLVKAPNVNASIKTFTSADLANKEAQTEFEKMQDIDDLANAIVNAFVKADIGVVIDNREFGRLVRKAVAY